VTDADLVAKKLAFVETCVRELRTLARPDLIETDVREERFVEHTLQLAVQAILDVASHIVSDDRLGEPKTNYDLFDLLRAAGWIDDELRTVLRRMAGFRNLVVHGYMAVDLAIVKTILERHLDDLLTFVRVVRAKLPPPADGAPSASSGP
jgi:uncharacterized protein YutE (UPF0331/DUF86 family)